MYYSTCYASPIGEMLIVSDGEAICGVWFLGQKHFKSSISSDLIESDDLAIFKKAKIWLDRYFNGENPNIDFKLKPEGSEFRKRVWKILSEIPYGETLTYGEIAQKISPSMSAQAVGGAVGHNPIAILIPCHRVLGSNGKLTGYAGGLDKKMELLKNFISEVRQNDLLWLLEAKPGLFAMVEDGNENSYIPVWSNEADAVSNISDDWEEYSVTSMNIDEFVGWMRELHEDEIGIAISTGDGGQMLPIPALSMKQLFVGADVDVEEDKKLVGEHYDEDWAEGIPDNWEEDYLDSLTDED